MKKTAKVLLAGLLISFLGALPLGTLNVTAFDIAASQGLLSAFWFAVAVVLVELVVVRLTLYGNEKFQLTERFTNYLFAFGIIFLAYLGVSSFMETAQVSEAGSKANLLPKISSTFVLGLLLSALNPLQIPFWMTWTKVLSTKGILVKSKTSYKFYLIGIGAGTMIGLGIFISLGKYVFSDYEKYSTVTNSILGLLYLGFSFYLLFLLLKKRLNLKFQ